MEDILLWFVNIIFILALLFGGIYYVEHVEDKSYKKGYEAGVSKEKSECIDRVGRLIQNQTAEREEFERRIKELERSNNQQSGSSGSTKPAMILAETVVNKMVGNNGRNLIEIDNNDKYLIDVEKDKAIKINQTIVRGVCFVYSNFRLFIKLADSVRQDIFEEDDWVSLQLHCVKKDNGNAVPKYEIYLKE